MCSKSTVEIPEWCHGRFSGLFIVNFEHNLSLFLLFLLSNLSIFMFSWLQLLLYFLVLTLRENFHIWRWKELFQNRRKSWFIKSWKKYRGMPSTGISFVTCSLAFNIRTYFLRKRNFIVKLLTLIKAEIMFNVCDTYF